MKENNCVDDERFESVVYSAVINVMCGHIIIREVRMVFVETFLFRSRRRPS